MNITEKTARIFDRQTQNSSRAPLNSTKSMAIDACAFVNLSNTNARKLRQQEGNANAPALMLCTRYCTMQGASSLVS